MPLWKLFLETVYVKSRTSVLNWFTEEFNFLFFVDISYIYNYPSQGALTRRWWAWWDPPLPTCCITRAETWILAAQQLSRDIWRLSHEFIKAGAWTLAAHQLSRDIWRLSNELIKSGAWTLAAQQLSRDIWRLSHELIKAGAWTLR